MSKMIHFITLDLLQYSIKTEVRNGNSFLFDPIRKKWIRITPEELVRQHFIQYLIHEMKYPTSLMKLEHALELNTLQKRSDIVIYTRDGNPWLLMECKAATINIDDKVMLQAVRYYSKIKSDYISLTNGHQTVLYNVSGNKFEKSFPVFPQ